MPTLGSLFAGIGGIDLGLERAGWTVRWQVEVEPFCQRVLAKHWPDVVRYGDIVDVDWSGVEPVDLVAGGFPCQPFSTAGKRLGLADHRWLWPEFARCVRDLRPRYVLVENVAAILVGRGMDAVLGDLAALGFDAEWECISAAAVGAPHLRDRVWIVGRRQDADANGGRREGVGVEEYAELAGASGDVADRLRAGGRRYGSALADADDARPAYAREGQPRLGLAGARAADHRAAAGRRRPGRGGAAALADAASIGPSRPRQPFEPVDPAADRQGPAGQLGDGGWWRVEPDVGRVADGVPARVDRLRGLGNAVVPQVVEWIGRRILELDEDR